MSKGGWLLHHLETATSSNRLLLEAIGSGGELDRDRSALLVDFQSAGMGRRDRGWYCPPGEGLLLSLRIDLPVSPNLGLLAQACCRVLLESLLEEAALAGRLEPILVWKWPNDLMLLDEQGPAKLAGILVQTQIQGSSCRAVCGFGLNLEQRRFPHDLRQRAVSLAMCGWPTGREALLDRLLTKAAAIPDLLRKGEDLQRGLEPHHLLAIVPCRYREGDALHEIRGTELLPDGRLRLCWDGDDRVFASGELDQRLLGTWMELSWRDA